MKISDYLRDFVKETQKGTCKTCLKAVPWNQKKLGSHKRTNCAGASAEEKELFKITRQPATSLNNSDVWLIEEDSNTSGTSSVLTAAKKSEIDAALGRLFCRTGISFNVADSEAFKDFVRLLNPAYAEVMPKSRTVSGLLLDQEYEKAHLKVTQILEQNENFVLISDGWTNTRGDHIVNFLVKAPGQPTVFYSAINTSGIYQDANAAADAICKVIEELGATKFCCLVTDHAPVMRAAWKVIERKHPHICAIGCAAHALNLLVKNILVPYKTGKYRK